MTREELKQIYYINKEIKMWQRELDRLQCKSLIGSQSLDGMPKGSGTSDKVADLAIEKEEIREIINGKLTEIQVQRKRILNYIESISDSTTRQIVYLYCVSNLNWHQVARELGEGYTADGVKQTYYRHLKKNGIN